VTLQVRNVMVEDRRERQIVERLVGDDHVDAVDELRREAAPHRGHADALELRREIRGVALGHALEAQLGPHLLHHLARAEVAREEDEALLEIDDRVVAQRERGAIENAEQERRERGRCLLDLVEEHDRERAVGRGRRRQLLLREDGLRFAMAEVSRGRANQLRHLVVRLEFAAVDLHDLAIAAVQDLGKRFDRARLAGTGGTEQQKDADGPILGVEPGLIHLDVRHDAPHRARLADHLARQQLDEIAVALTFRLEGRDTRRVVRRHG
jgi:hypothetical protein